MELTSLVLISNSYIPIVGGSEVEAQRVALGLIQRGHKIEIWCAGGPPMPSVSRWTDPVGVPVRILTRHSRGRWKDITFACRVGWQLWRERKNYEIVYFLMQGLHLVTGLAVARWLRKPIVMKISGSGVIPLMQASWVGRLELRWLGKWALRVMVLNDGMIAEAVEAGIPREKLYWMPNPIDTDEFCPANLEDILNWRQRHGIGTNSVAVIYVGRLSPEKGLVPLLRGFARAARQIPELVLLLVGDGIQRSALEDFSSRLGLGPEQVRFIGQVDLCEVPFWLRSSDIFALLSPKEGFSCALAEAMSTGLASVVTDIPANRQLIEDQRNGFLISYDDDLGAETAFLALARDAQMRRQAGQAARQSVLEKYSTKRVLDRYDALLSEASVTGTIGGQ